LVKLIAKSDFPLELEKCEKRNNSHLNEYEAGYMHTLRGNQYWSGNFR